MPGHHGSCCTLEDRDFIIGPHPDAEEFVERLSDKLGREIEYREVFVDYEEGKNLFIIITSNRGLCGGYNSQVLKKAIYGLKNLNNDEEIDLLMIGKKGDSFMRRTGKNIVASFFEIPDIINLSDISSIFLTIVLKVVGFIPISSISDTEPA
jgi:F-type H+-transporting ATPase subunit gamma